MNIPVRLQVGPIVRAFGQIGGVGLRPMMASPRYARSPSWSSSKSGETEVVEEIYGQGNTDKIRGMIQGILRLIAVRAHVVKA